MQKNVDKITNFVSLFINLCTFEAVNFLFLNFSDMRKACSRDVKQKSVIPLIHPVRPEDVE